MKNLLERLFDAQVASCTCMTKTPDIEHHDEMCHTRLFEEARREIEQSRYFTRGVAERLGIKVVPNEKAANDD